MTLAEARTLFIALCVAILSGCALLAPAKMETKKYLLSAIPLDLPHQSAHAATLLILAPDTEPIYATPLMAYTTTAYEIAYFSQNEWAATPAQMIQPLIVETLRHTHYFRDVLSAPNFGHHTFVLRSQILELKQDFTSDPASLHLAIRFQLSRAATDQLIASKELTMQEPMRERTPYAGVVAANAAMAKLLREVTRFVIDNAR